jgi:hypothetical protein
MIFTDGWPIDMASGPFLASSWVEEDREVAVGEPCAGEVISEESCPVQRMYGLRVLPSNVEQSGTVNDGFDAPTFDNYLDDTLEKFV